MPSSNLFDLAAKISVDHSQSDRALTDTQKKVLAAEREFKKLDATVKSTSTALRSDLGGALSNVSPRLGALVGAGGAASAAAAGLTLIAAGIGAASAGIWKLANVAAEAGGDLHDMSQQTNFAVRTLSTLKAVAATSGTDLESLSTSLVIFQKNLQKSAQGNEELQTAFKALGVTSRDNEEALRQVFTGLASVKDGTAQTALAMQVFGRSGKDMLGVVKEIDGKLDETTTKLQKWGLVLTNEDVKAADLFSDQLENLELRLGGIARVIGAETLPAFSAFFEHIEASLDANKTSWREWGETIAKVILSVEVLFGGLLNMVSKADWTNFLPIYGPIKAASDFISGMSSTADSVVAAYNRLINPNFSTPQREGGAGIFRKKWKETPLGTTSTSPGEPSTVEGWKKALEMLQRVNNEMDEEVRRFDEDMARISASVSQAILDQAFAIKALETNTPDWLQRAQEFIRAKADEGYIWDEDTKRIYLNNAARLEQQRILREGATRPRMVEQFTKDVGEDSFLGAFGKGGGGATAGEDLLRRAQGYASSISGILNNAIYEGFRDGGMRGVAALGLGLLDMLNNIFFRRLEEGLSGLLSGGSGGGGWGGFFKALIGIGGSAVGGGLGGSFSKGGLGGGVLGKASGGSVFAGLPYMVGERGREMFVPSTNGQIVPNDKLGGHTFNVIFQVRDARALQSRDTQAQVARQMKQVMQRAALTG